MLLSARMIKGFLDSGCAATSQVSAPVLEEAGKFGDELHVWNLQVDRAALPAPQWDQRFIQPYLPPQSRLEMEVQLIWVAVMNKKEMISCNADFSEIGGNMMHAVIANGIVR